MPDLTQLGIIGTLTGVVLILAKIAVELLEKRRARLDGVDVVPDPASDAAARTFGAALRELKDVVKETGRSVSELRGMMSSYQGDQKLLVWRVEQLEHRINQLDKRLLEVRPS